MTDPDSRTAWKTFTEEIEVTGNQLVAHITKLFAEGNVRTIKVRSQNSDVHFDIPMTAGLVTGGIVALAAPWLVVLGALAGMVAKLKIEIVRQQPTDGTTGSRSAMPEKTGS
jgi:hypothetical protein